MSEEKDIIVGIDLGTTYSVVSVCRGRGQVHVVTDEGGSRTVPSVVAFDNDGRRYVGAPAKDMPPTSRVYDAKRLLGRSFDDVCVQNDVKRWPFKVVDLGGAPRFLVQVGKDNQLFAPEEISATVLSHLKEAAEAFLETKVEKAVVTVPAYFSERQREATKVAGKIAGLEVVGILNEPSAAAIAYGLDRLSRRKTVFVYDLGGGTFDVSILQIDNKDFTVLGSDGDSHLGGQDFDVRLVDYFIKDIDSKHGINLEGNAVAIEDLRSKCEHAKLKLSSLPEVSLSLMLPRSNIVYKSSASQALLENLCADLFQKTIDISARVLKQANLSQKEIDEVLLVGGSTRIPKIRAMLQTFFGGKELKRSINADEAVASGAALYAAGLGGDRAVANRVVLREVTALSLGKSVIGGRYEVIIPRNTRIPCKRTKTFSTTFDNQVYVNSKIYQGERPLVKENIYLNKEYTITVPPRPAGEVKMETTFELNADGLLTVTCLERSSGARQEVTIDHNDTHISETDIQEMLKRARRFKKRDEEEKKKIEAQLRDEHYLV